MLGLLLLALVAFSWMYWLAAGVLVQRFFRAADGPAAGRTPPFSILKPVKGLDPGAYENFASFCRQDYPDFELLFGVMDPEDPALAVIERLRRDFPERSIRVELAQPLGANNKVSILHHLAQQARHALLVVSDSDVRVPRDLLRRIGAPLADPAVGLVTCPYRGEAPKSFAAILEALHMGMVFLPSSLVGRTVLGMRFALGACVALRKGDLERIGGFAALADQLADDYQLGWRIARLGLKVALSHSVVASVLGAARLSETWDREVRWARCTRASRPGGFFGLMLTMSTPLALGYILATGVHEGSLAVMAASLAVRYAVAGSVAVTVRDPNLRWLWLLPARDLLSGAVWLAAAIGHKVVWRGERFVVRRDGTLRALAPRQPPSAPSPEQAPPFHPEVVEHGLGASDG